MVVIDYFSKYIEVALLKYSTAQEVVVKFKSIISRWGIPEIVKSDNGPCYSSYLFKQFAAEYGFNHVTSSPRFPQSNGQAESAVKIVKKIILNSTDPNLGLLAYRTTKLECGYSPSELIMGRNPRTNLPTNLNFLIPKWHYLENFRNEREKEISKQVKVYDKRHRARHNSELSINDRVWITNMKRYGKIVNKGPEPRSYVVDSNGSVIRRNRAHLVKVKDNSSDTDFDFTLLENIPLNETNKDSDEIRREIMTEPKTNNNISLSEHLEVHPEVQPSTSTSSDSVLPKYSRYGRMVKPRTCGCCTGGNCI